MNAMELFRGCVVFLLLTTGAHALGVTKTEKGIRRFGPGNCILLSRTVAGSCMITTSCQGQDTSKTEFAFNCVSEQGASQIHSFGFGGFEDNEEFDTEVRCARCEGQMSGGEPAPVFAVAQPKERSYNGPMAFTDEPMVHNLPKHSLPAALAPHNHHHKSHHHRRTERGARGNVLLKKRRGGQEEQQDQVNDAVILKAKLQEAKTQLTSDKARVLTLESRLAAAKAEQAMNQPTMTAADRPVNFASHEHGSGYWPGTAPKAIAAEKYGPKDCISVWRNEEGHCVMRTQCKGVDMKDYEYGLTCVGSDGVAASHTFGKDSFDPEEQFDTLIRCEKCLAAHDDHLSSKVGRKVKAVKEDIKELRSVMQAVSVSLKKLNDKVFPKAPAPAPAPAMAAAPAASSALVQTADDEDGADGDDADGEGEDEGW